MMNRQKTRVQTEQQLTQVFVDSIKPTNSGFSHAANVAASKIVDILQREQRQYQIGFVRIVGTYGNPPKSTANDDEPHYDMIVYINHKTARLEPAANFFSGVLHKHGFPCRVSKCVYKHSIKLCTEEGVSFDLILTNNFDYSTKSKSGLYKVQKQYKAAFEEMTEGSAKLEGFDAWLSETSKSKSKESLSFQNLDFIYTQPEILKQTIILAKYWDVEVDHRDYICGRSCIIELMVIHANDGKSLNRLSTCFRRFLEAMADLKHASAVFDTYYNSEEVESDRPLILDPLSQYHDFGLGLSRRAVKAFQEAAGLTLKKWGRFEKSGDIGNLFVKSKHS